MSFAIDTTSYRSLNYEQRPPGVQPSILVLHDGEGTAKSDLERLTNNRVPVKNRVSAHYYVTRAGLIYQLVYDELAAWHAGESAWGGFTTINPQSIGVESEHKRGQDWPQIQRDALAWLFRRCISRWHITQSNVTCHRWIAPGRKFDPTDWLDAELRVWIAGLYSAPPPTTVYKVRRIPVYQDRACRGIIAGTLGSGDSIVVDRVYDDTDSVHLASGLGFVRRRDVEPL